MRNEDHRSKKIVFVSNCLLNTNNKVWGLARYGGFCREVFEVLADYGVGIQQIDCPETLHLGIQRWYHTKNLYDNVGFRRICREVSERTVDYMESYKLVGYETVAFLVCNGSPTCGYDVTSYDENWGGNTNEAFEYNDAIVPGMGVLIEEMHEAIKDRGLELPPFFGLSLDDASVPLDEIIADFKEFMTGAMARFEK
jgi:predicted secreted protein